MTPEHKAAIAEGRRRARKAKQAMEHALADMPSDMADAVKSDYAPVRPPPPNVEVIYRPFDGNPHTVKWNGIVFRANVQLMLNKGNRAHYIEQLLPKKIEGANGETHTKHVPVKVFMGDIARMNPEFEVDGERAKKLVNKRILPPAGHGWAEDHEDDISESTELEDVA